MNCTPQFSGKFIAMSVNDLLFAEALLDKSIKKPLTLIRGKEPK